MNYLITFIDENEPFYQDRNKNMHYGSILSLLKKGSYNKPNNVYFDRLVIIYSSSQSRIFKNVRESLTYFNKEDGVKKIKLENQISNIHLDDDKIDDLRYCYSKIATSVKEIHFTYPEAMIYLNLNVGSPNLRLASSLFCMAMQGKEQNCVFGCYSSTCKSDLEYDDETQDIKDNHLPDEINVKGMMETDYSDEFSNYAFAYNYTLINDISKKRNIVLTNNAMDGLNFIMCLIDGIKPTEAINITKRSTELRKVLSPCYIYPILKEEKSYGLVNINKFISKLIMLDKLLLANYYDVFATSVSPILFDAILLIFEKEKEVYKDSIKIREFTDYRSFLISNKGAKYSIEYTIDNQKFTKLNSLNSINGIKRYLTTSFKSPLIKMNASPYGLYQLRYQINYRNNIKEYDELITIDNTLIKTFIDFEKGIRDDVKHTSCVDLEDDNLKKASLNLFNSLLECLEKTTSIRLNKADIDELFFAVNTYLQKWL